MSWFDTENCLLFKLKLNLLSFDTLGADQIITVPLLLVLFHA